MRKISRKKKFFRVFRKKLLKPVIYTILAGVMVYLAVGNVVFWKKLKDYDKPHFLISRISEEFDEVEYMHLLLTIQEINKDVLLRKQLIDFVNLGFPTPCPRELKNELYKMNWQSQAFLIRVKKMFKMYEVYDREARLDQTIKFLEEEMKGKKNDENIVQQINMLKMEKSNVIKGSLGEKEYKFISEYYGIVAKLKK